MSSHPISSWLPHASPYAWLLNIALWVMLGIIVSFLIQWIYQILSKRFDKTPLIWDDALLDALHQPLFYLIWFFVLSFIIQMIIQRLYQHLTIPIAWSMMYQLALIAFSFVFSMRLIHRIQKSLVHRQRTKTDKTELTTISAICQLARVLVLFIAVIMGMQTLGIPMSALLALGGVGGIAIGFAAKDILANFLGGLMIYVDRPFEVGDWISSPDKNIEGTVEHIGWRLTQIRAFDKRPIYIPNALFSTIILKNPSRMTNRRIKTIVGVRYQDAKVITPMLKAIESMLTHDKEIDHHQTTFVNLVELGKSSLNFEVYTFTKTTDWVTYQRIQQRVLLSMVEIIHQHGANCAFPTRTLELPKETMITTRPLEPSTP